MRSVLLVLSLVATLALLPGVAFAHGGASISIAGHIHANGPMEVTGVDFEPGELVTLELRRQGMAPIPLGTASAAADGSFRVALHVPAEVMSGLYELTAVTGNETTTAEATIAAAAEGGTDTPAAQTGIVENDRPAAETVGLVLVTALAAAGGAAIILLGRRHAARPYASS